MANPGKRPKDDLAAYYDRHGVLGELGDANVSFALDEELRRQIVRGGRARKLKNVTIKLDPVHVQALRKIATLRAVPYQTLIRQWLAEGIRRELNLTGTCSSRRGLRAPPRPAREPSTSRRRP